MDIGTKVLSYVAAFLFGVAVAWYVTSGLAERDMLQYERDLYAAQAAKRAASDKLRRAREEVEELQKAAIDKSEAAHKTTVRTVTKEVIKYVESPDAGHCSLPASWVQLYNQSLGLPVPTAGQP